METQRPGILRKGMTLPAVSGDGVAVKRGFDAGAPGVGRRTG